jgi:protein-disulfide isomerase
MSRARATLKPPVSDLDHCQGDAAAPITLVEYGDYECPHCGRAYPIVKRVQRELGTTVRFVFRNFPLAEMHPRATAAARMAEAAAQQGQFWPMHDLLYEHQDRLDELDLIAYAKRLRLGLGELQKSLDGADVRDRVQADFASGVRSGVNGTPTFFVNGERFDGDWSDAHTFARALRDFVAR